MQGTVTSRHPFTLLGTPDGAEGGNGRVVVDNERDYRRGSSHRASRASPWRAILYRNRRVLDLEPQILISDTVWTRFASPAWWSGAATVSSVVVGGG
jgi:hypothetical protein